MSDEPTRAANPKAFISYSWSSPSHQKWVLDLAMSLRENGVDVLLDKWELREGHDKNVFMEQMVSDPAVTKVIMICDKIYAEKADDRQGGVGTEAQIISGEVYGKSNQDKFCAILSEVDEEGRPYLPIYYKSRVYIDLSSENAYATNYEQLLRWIFSKPAYPKPSLGKPPLFVTAAISPTLLVGARSQQAFDALKQHSANSIGFLNDYLDRLSASFETLRIAKKNDRVFDEEVIQSIDNFLPYRNEFIDLLRLIAQSNLSEAHIQVVQRFFERAAPFLTVPPEGTSSWVSWDFDNYRFIVSELFLYSVSLLLRFEHFSFAALLLNTKYFLGHEVQYGRESMQHYGVLWQKTTSLDARNERLKLNKASLRAYLLEQRSHNSGLDFQYLMQGDFTLFLQDARFALESKSYVRWWPETLVYGERIRAPFEIYARAESLRYFDKLKAVFQIQHKDDFAPLIKAFNERRMGIPGPNAYYSPDPIVLMNYEKLASSP
jgi:hypothetical protein